MKQIVQYLDTGKTVIVEAPSPKAKSGHVVVDTTLSLISAGTERMLVEFSKGGLVAKARSQPEKVRQVLDKVRTDGLSNTVEAVRSKLSEPLPLGYSNVGKVASVGAGVSNLRAGDRVVSNGPHANRVRVPQNLTAKIPDGVSDEAASFTVVGAIALQGIRLAQPTLGECFAVVGTGLIGLVTVQLLVAQGCRVIAIDLDEKKLALARKFGAETVRVGKGVDPVKAALAFSRGNGVDGVIITASAKSNEPIKQAAHMCRRRGRIVLVGVVGLDLDRADFYEKELTFQVSCSYGPGRYDSDYEDKGQDYPIGYVRWTEQRNFEAVLDMMAMGRIDMDELVSHRFDFEKAANAYEVLSNDSNAMGIVLNYGEDDARDADTMTLASTLAPSAHPVASEPVCGFVGAGNYASRILIPAFKEAGATLHTLATSGGLSASLQGDSGGFGEATTNTDAMLENTAINTAVIATQHNTHSIFSAKALEYGKNVFVEKPLAVTKDQLENVRAAYDKASQSDFAPRLMVGFNRRFAPHIVKMKELLTAVSEPVSFIVTCNAGAIPGDHWTQDDVAGGGRIIGEACHFIDLLRFLTNYPICHVHARRLGNDGSRQTVEDVAVITLGFEDGSFGTINYFANGAQSFPKERVEVFAGGGILQLDNFRAMRGYGWNGFSKMKLFKQDKGQKACATAFVEAIRKGNPSPIPADELFEVAEATIEATTQLRAQAEPRKSTA